MLSYRMRKCKNCGKEYEKNKQFSLTQWNRSLFCTVQCAADAKRKKDGMNKYERYRRKKGSLKQGSPEWLERIKARTSEAMLRPDVNMKIRQPRSPLELEHRIKISNALAGRMPRNIMFGSNNYPNVQRGEYECSKGSVYFRSKWEANYALYLDFLVKQGEIEKWEYEADVFVFEQIKFGTRSYRPDFKIWNKNGSFEYHEVKGYMDSKSKTKLKRMAKYYPEVKLILVERSFYMDLVRKLGKVLRFY